MTVAVTRSGMFDSLSAEGAPANLALLRDPQDRPEQHRTAAALSEAGTVEGNQREPRELAALGRATEWLNSPRLTAASLSGKVVLVDFCTYTCINWLRTLPYVRAWAQKYRQGLVSI